MLGKNLWMFLFLAGFALVKGDENCHKQGILVYEDLGCKSIKEKPDDACPSHYDCRHFHELGKHCFFQGHKYDEGESLHENVTALSCNAACRCGQEGTFTCAILDCPEWLGSPLRSQDCARTYKLDQCCSTGEICPPFENLATCEADGKTYHEGQKFYPKDSCSVCVCQKGYSGKYEAPYCRPISCAIELKHVEELEKHCAPVYDVKDGAQALCCPKFWACLSESDVVNSAEKPSSKSETCIFGNKNLKIGDFVEKYIEKYGKRHAVRCDCQVPPLLTCVIKDETFLKG